MLLTLDLVGIFVFAISGGLVAVRNQLDILGVVVLAMATGLGGGVIRDVLIGDVPPTALLDWWYLLVPAVAGLMTFWFHPAVGRVERVVNVFDAAGLGMFCVTGALKAHEYGLGPAPSARGEPSTWYAEVAAPQRKPSGNAAVSLIATPRTVGRAQPAVGFRLSARSRFPRRPRAGNLGAS